AKRHRAGLLRALQRESHRHRNQGQRARTARAGHRRLSRRSGRAEHGDQEPPAWLVHNGGGSVVNGQHGVPRAARGLAEERLVTWRIATIVLIAASVAVGGWVAVRNAANR